MDEPRERPDWRDLTGDPPLSRIEVLQGHFESAVARHEPTVAVPTSDLGDLLALARQSRTKEATQ